MSSISIQEYGGKIDVMNDNSVRETTLGERFYDFRVENLEPVLFDLESRYRNAMLPYCIWILSTGAGGGACLVTSSAFPSGSAPSIMLGVLAFISFTVCTVTIVLASTRLSVFKSTFRYELFSRCVNFCAPALQIIPKWFVSKNKFTSSGLYTSRPDYYSGRNLADGMIGETHVSFSEVWAGYTLSRKYSFYKIADRGNLFNGFCCTLFYRNLDIPETFIIPSFFSLFSENISALTKELSYNQEFDEDYYIYTRESPCISRFVGPLIPHILSIIRETGNYPIISMRSKTIFMAFPENTSHFEPRITGKLKSMRPVEKYCMILSMCTEIAEINF